jgi:hypothetical protein
VSERRAPGLSDDELPPIIDPYVAGPALAPRVPGAETSRTKTWGIATVAFLLLGVSTLFVGAAGAVTAYRLLSDPSDGDRAAVADDRDDDADAEDEDDEQDDAEDAEDDDRRALPTRPRNIDPQGHVPKETERKSVGELTVVDVGYDVPSLEHALREERESARARDERILVMTVREPCEPCAGVDASLGHPLMQHALEGIRLVRVDIDVFHDDLRSLDMFPSPYPGYFLFGPDLAIRDAIDGGEWGPDVAENIAPILGPFVRGEYENRKTRYRVGGIAL